MAKYAVFLYEATASDLSLPRRYASTLQRESSRVTHERGAPKRSRHEASGEDGGGVEWSGANTAGELSGPLELAPRTKRFPRVDTWDNVSMDGSR